MTTPRTLHVVLIGVLLFWLCACANNTEKPTNERYIPQQKDRSSLSQFGKSDFDRLADVEIRENVESLKLLAIKLYKRNPAELKKSTSDDLPVMIDWIFEGQDQHKNLFASLDNKQGKDAIFLAFNPTFTGDRVLAFTVGLHTMLLKAHGYKNEFYLTDVLDPQILYNLARNFEIAAWKISNARDESGVLYLLTNEINAKERNLSFEREFGKMIGRTDLYAITLAEKSERLISRVIQNLATALFLPI
jgi:hypothetical protein